jgi:tRNA modification GTPase
MSETIAAIATAHGIGAIGVIRISGRNSLNIGISLTHLDIQQVHPRKAVFAKFFDCDHVAIDEGLILFFPEPHSYTGEHVIEIQAHGNPLLLNILLERVYELGARQANPGEFSQRAFLNGKIDLTKAEAIADLIACSSHTAAKLAGKTLTGVFSDKIQSLLQSIIHIRLTVESSLDFSDEGDIPQYSKRIITEHLNEIKSIIDHLLKIAKVGALIRDGLVIVIAGLTNAGKSCFLNQLTGEETAIVTSIPGTTRDTITARVEFEGLPIYFVDTAGIRQSIDPIELEGIKKARIAITSCHHMLWIHDDTLEFNDEDLPKDIMQDVRITIVRNKIDLSGRTYGKQLNTLYDDYAICAKSGEGLDDLMQHIKQCAGISEDVRGEFLARKRHLDALNQCHLNIFNAVELHKNGLPQEILAEELRKAQHFLSEITGAFTSEDLLGEIFSNFCIGK